MTLSPTQRQWLKDLADQWLKDLAEGKNPWRLKRFPLNHQLARTSDSLFRRGLIDNAGNLTPDGRDAVREMSGGGK